MSAARFEIVSTSEGAPALLDRESGEVMHPGKGPLHEAETLYVGPSKLAARLAETSADPLVVLDVGLGAGTNALCALNTALGVAGVSRRLEIVSFDLTSDGMRHAHQSEQRAAFGFGDVSEEAVRALLSQQRYESPRVHWRLVLGDARESLARELAHSADIVFWDLYSSRTKPELWGESTFALLRRACRDGATVHTYSAATATRSALLLAGFCVGLGPTAGAKQKHTTLAATRLIDLAQPLDWRWLESFSREQPGVVREATMSREARARLALLPQLGRP